MNTYGDIFAAERNDARSKTSAEATALHHWEDKKSEIEVKIAKCHNEIEPLSAEYKKLVDKSNPSPEELAQAEELSLKIEEIKEAHGLFKLGTELSEANQGIKANQQGLKEARVNQRRWARRAARRAKSGNTRPFDGHPTGKNRHERRKLARAKG